MKKLFPLAFIAILGLIMVTASCQKNKSNNDVHYCWCGYTDKHGNDSAWGALTGWSAAFSYDAATKQCQKYEDSLKSTKPSIECKLDSN